MNAADKLIVQHLAPFMETRGFKYRADHAGFVQKRDFGFVRLAYHSTLIGYEGGYLVSVGLAVRHDRVDEVVNRLGHIWGAANQKKTTTIYRGLGFFPFGEEPFRQVVRSGHLEEDAAIVAEKVKAMMIRDGDEFLARFSSLLECSRGLNDPIETHAHPLLNGYPLRAYYGIAAASFAEPERVRPLIDSYTGYCRQSGWVDPLVYEIGKGEAAEDAIQTRLNAVAEMAASARYP